jgi:hypothetical protein
MQLAVAGRHIVLEESKCTRDLGGATFAQASTIAWKKGLTIAFIFSVGPSLRRVRDLAYGVRAGHRHSLRW